MNSSFSKINPYLQVAWDSTSLGEFKTCPYKYYLSIIEGFVPRVEGHDLSFGLVYHSALETYDKARVEGASHDEATYRAVEYAMRSSGSWNPVIVDNREQMEELLNQGYRVLQDSAACEVVMGKFVPWSDDFKPKTRRNLIRSIVWYLETFGPNAPEETVILDSGKAAVELSFSFDTGWKLSTGESVILCGHLDRVAKVNDQEWIFDRKTTKTTIGSDYFKRFSPDNQMSLYAAAGRIIFHRPIAGVIVDAAQIAVGFTRFSRGFANRTPGQIEEWLSDTREWIRKANEYAVRKIWPMNDKACFLCHFKEICSKDPSARKAFLESNYTRRVWDPLERR